MSELRMWIAIRSDLSMPSGKLAAQVGHGFVQAAFRAAELTPRTFKSYMDGSQAKIAVRVDTLAALRRVASECEHNAIPHAIITDAGRTFFSEPTETVCAFGPAIREELPSYLRRLRLYGDGLSPTPASRMEARHG